MKQCYATRCIYATEIQCYQTFIEFFIEYLTYLYINNETTYQDILFEFTKSLGIMKQYEVITVDYDIMCINTQISNATVQRSVQHELKNQRDNLSFVEIRAMNLKENRIDQKAAEAIISNFKKLDKTNKMKNRLNRPLNLDPVEEEMKESSSNSHVQVARRGGQN